MEECGERKLAPQDMDTEIRSLLHELTTIVHIYKIVWVYRAFVSKHNFVYWH